MRPALQLSDFGKALNTARLENRYSIANLARHLKAGSRDLIEDWEAGYDVPPKYVLNALFAMSHGLRRFESDLRSGNFVATPRPVRVAIPIPLPGASTVDEDSQTYSAPPPAPLPSFPTFGEALRHAREAAGLTQTALGELCDVVSSAVSFWEEDVNAPIVAHLDKLLDLFPELERAPKPQSKDMMKPGREAGTEPAPVVTGALRASTRLDPDIIARPVYVTEPEPMPQTDPAPPVVNLPAIVRWTKATNQLNLDQQQAKALGELLQAGAELGLGVADVGQVLAQWPAQPRPGNALR